MSSLRASLLIPLLALSACISSAASSGETALPYRRFIPNQILNLEGSSFKLSEDGNAITGQFPDQEALVGGKARARARLERELPPGTYLVFLSIPYVDSTVVRVDVPDPLLKTDDDAPLDEDGDDLAELEEPQQKKGYRKEAGGLSVGLEIAAGKATKTFYFPRQAGNFRGGFVVDAKQAFREVSVRVLTREPKITINQLYVSARPGDFRCNREFPEKELVCGIDTQLIRRETNGQRRFLTGPEPDNHFRNGSFEVGCGSYEWCMPYQSSQTVNPRLLDSEVAFDGDQSLCLRLQRHRYVEVVAPSAQLMHKVLKLKPNATYYFRGMFRADAPAKVGAKVVTAYGPEAAVGERATSIDGEWKPLAFQFETGAEDRGYYLTIAARTATKKGTWREPYTGEQLRVWADALVLSARKPEGFVPAASVEIGVTWEVPGKVFYAEEPVVFRLRARNYSGEGAPAKVTVRYRVVDYFDVTRIDETVTGFGVAPSTTAERALGLDLKRTGAFRLLLDGVAVTEGQETRLPLQEYSFCVLRRPPEKMHNTFGAYINVTPEPLEIMSRAGIRRTVTLSSANDVLSCWEQMEPKQGEFVWRDDLVEAANKHQVEIIVDLEPQETPEWAMNPDDEADAIRFDGNRLKQGGFSRKAWSNFVENVVRHYKDSIHTWLIVDEPYHYFSMKSYFDVLKTASLAARKADPDCKVLAHGCYYPGNLPALEGMGIAPLVDGLSAYSRDPGQGAKLRNFATKHGKSLMNVEYSWQLSMYQTVETPQGSYDPFWRLAWYRGVGTGLAALPLRAMAWSGATGFNRYDARYPGGDFIQLDNFKCMFEYDGALKPSAVAYAVAAGLLDGFRGVGELKLNKHFEAHLFEEAAGDDAGRFAITFWTRNRLLHAPISLPDGVQGYDIMGNSLRKPPRAVLLSRDVNYLLGPKQQLEATKEMVSALEAKPIVHSEGRVELDEPSGQYVYRVTVRNLIADEPMKVRIGARSQRKFWEGAKDLGEIVPGGEAEAIFGLNAYRGETDKPRHGGHYLFIEALGTAVQ